ncbi:hypothetical protein MBLNU457_g2437t1 [Dothideomycetes sp. NU457]
MASSATDPPAAALNVSDASQDASPEELAKVYLQLLELKAVVLADKHPRLKLSQDAKQKLRASEPRSRSGQGSADTLANGQSSRSEVLPGIAQNQAAFMTNRITAGSMSETDILPKSKAKPNVRQEKGKEKEGSGMIQDNVIDDAPESRAHPRYQNGTSQDAPLSRRQIVHLLLQHEWSQYQQRHQHPNRGDTSLVPVDDLDGILEKAQATVNPVSGILPPVPIARISPGTSFDENDYYSSQHWSSDDREASYEPPAQVEVLQKVPAANVLPGLGSTTSHPVASSSNSRRPQFDPVSSHLPKNFARTDVVMHDTEDTDDLYMPEGEESDYSPPAPGHDTMDLDEGEVSDNESDYAPDNAVPPVSNDLRRVQASNQPAHSASPQVPVVRNNLTQIAAPQPSRISPLASANLPGLDPAILQSLTQLGGNPDVVAQLMQALRPHLGGQQFPQPSSRPFGFDGSSDVPPPQNQPPPLQPLLLNSRGNTTSEPQSSAHPSTQVSPRPSISSVANLTNKQRAKRKKAKLNEAKYERQLAVREKAQARREAKLRKRQEKREKKKEQKRANDIIPAVAKVSRNVHVATSPEPAPASAPAPVPVIKDEPQSPPPFAQHTYQSQAQPQAQPQQVYQPPPPPQPARLYTPGYYQQPPPQQTPVYYAPPPQQPQYQLPPYAYPAPTPAAQPAVPQPARRIITDQYGNKYYAVEKPGASAMRASVAPPSMPAPSYHQPSVAPPSMQPPSYYQPPPSVHYTPAPMAAAPAPRASVAPPPMEFPPREVYYDRAPRASVVPPDYYAPRPVTYAMAPPPPQQHRVVSSRATTYAPEHQPQARAYSVQPEAEQPVRYAWGPPPPDGRYAG